VSTFETRDERDDKPIFIHSELDDYGLSAVEFRVYARLARRSGQTAAFESVPSMAKEFEVSDRTVQRALKVLIRARLISEQIRPGKSTRYTLNPRSVWAPKTQLKDIRNAVSNKSGDTTAPRPHVTGDTTEGGGVTPRRGVVVTPQRDEGSSSEGTKPNGGGRAPRATPPPAAFAITRPMRDWAQRKAPAADLELETENFLDHHRARGSLFKDWNAAWRTWMRNSIKFAGSGRQTQAEMNRGGRGFVH
jgi:predicted transcriptional regulator